MSYKIQYKTTIWQEIVLDPKQLRSWDTKGEIIERLNSNPQSSPWELFESNEVNTLYDTESLMTVEENDGQETIELWDDDKLIWTNKE